METAFALCLGLSMGALSTWAILSFNPFDLWALRQLNRSKNQLLEMKLAVAEQQRHVNTLLEEALQKERNRISDELHDDLLQQMAGIRLLLLHLPAIHQLPHGMQDDINRIANDLGFAMNTARSLVWDFRLPEVHERNIGDLLEALCKKIGGSAFHSLQFVEVMKEWERPLGDGEKKELCRIVQESVHNAIKYSNGWGIQVILQWHADRMSLEILDDGEGITGEQQGFGIDNLHRRAKRIGAALTVQRNQPRGTEVRVDLPYNVS